MSLFADPAEHADNPPETWTVVRVADRCYRLCTKDGATLGSSYQRKRDAEQDRHEGFYVNLYEDERRWYAGQPVTHWKPVRAANGGAGPPGHRLVERRLSQPRLHRLHGRPALLR